MADPERPEPVERPLPPQATMGLLDYITAHSLDEDYAHVAGQRGAAAKPPGGRRDMRLASVAALGVFGLLVATAGVQTARSEPVRESSRDALVAQVQDQRSEMDEARAEVLRLRRTVERAQEEALAASESGQTLQEQLEALELVTGAAAATGPGVRVVVDDNPDASTGRQVVFDKDLQILVNGLWSGGAEAVSINDQRVTSLTSIRTAGDAITVNLRSLSRPYVVNALGDPDQLPARFVESPAGSWWLNLRSVYGLQFAMTREDSLTVPAAPPLTLRHARRPTGEER
jgi:uncharacterized protein YlxW (UPF0749 family)